MLKRRLFPIAIVVAVGLSLAGCDDSKSSDNQEGHDHAHQGQAHHDHQGEGHHEHQGDEHHGEMADKDGEKASGVEVPNAGKEFDPAVSVDKLPEGAWACDMGGTAHYAAMEKGDGRCPVCNMMLSKVE